MRKRLIIVATVFALAGGIATAAPSQAEHIPAEQASPCRPDAPEGEEAVGYADADVQRELPTIYYNATDPQRAYIGACGGGSAGAPIRYVEIRMTPGGPYVYGSDAAGGRAFGGCTGDHTGGFHSYCADATTASGDARDLSGRARTEPLPALGAGEDTSDPRYSHTEQTWELEASQDGVTLTGVTKLYFQDHYSQPAYVKSTHVVTFAVTRDDNGVVTLGRTSSDGCELGAEDDLRDADPPVYTESGPASCPTPVRTASPLVDTVIDAIVDAVPPPPAGTPSAAACRPSPEPGEQTVPLGEGAPAIIYVNTTAAQPYAGACTGGTDGEPVRYVEVRETAGGPFVYVSDGSGGHVENKCLVLLSTPNNYLYLCASAALTPSRTDATVTAHYEHEVFGSYRGYEESVRASQYGVEVISDEDQCGGCVRRTTRYVRRSPDGRVERGETENFFGFTCDRGYRVNLADPASSGPYEEGDFC